MADNEAPYVESEEPELTASEVDELTHAELLCMYKDSEENIRFSKLIQWRTTGGTLAIFVLLMLLAFQYRKGGDMAIILFILTCLIGSASVSMLVIFQSWQGTERRKIQLILGRLSSLARDVYNRKSKRTADIERYLIFSFMCCAIMIAGFFVLSRLKGWFPV